VIYVMTHDSVAVGEDGPTHEPVEQLASLRTMPHLTILRPADANEVSYAWRVALARYKGPSMLVLTRQNLPVADRSKLAGAEGVMKGAYVLSREKGSVPDALLIASGSEVQLILAAQEKLAAEGIDARVISMPSWELFREQTQEYRDEILPPRVTARLAVEAGSPLGWHEWVGSKGDILGITKFGASAPYQEIFQYYGFTVENIISRVRSILT